MNQEQEQEQEQMTSQELKEESWSLELQTVLNPTDEHGILLMKHGKNCGLPIINCQRAFSDLSSNSQVNDSVEDDLQSFTSTPHVIVLVSQNERSFIAHLGCIAHFHAKHINTKNN